MILLASFSLLVLASCGNSDTSPQENSEKAYYQDISAKLFSEKPGTIIYGENGAEGVICATLNGNVQIAFPGKSTCATALTMSSMKWVTGPYKIDPYMDTTDSSVDFMQGAVQFKK